MHIHTIESIMEMLKSAPDIYNKINKLFKKVKNVFKK